MDRHHILSLSVIAAVGLTLLPGSAVSQQKFLKDQLVDTGTFVSQGQTLPNGSKIEAFDANPKGMNIFDANGRYYRIQLRSDLPKMASNSRPTPMPEEAKSIAAGSLASENVPAIRRLKVAGDGSTGRSFANAASTRRTFKDEPVPQPRVIMGVDVNCERVRTAVRTMPKIALDKLRRQATPAQLREGRACLRRATR
jgi:hypothetical protein